MKKSFVRLIIAVSIDGKIAFPDCGKTRIGGESDRQVLENALAWADCTLMGGETLRANKSTCLIKNTKLLKERSSLGKSAQPISIIVSEKGIFDKNWIYFQQPIQRWLISHSPSNNCIQNGFTNNILFDENWEKTVNQLNDLGLYRIALLGGSKLLYSMLTDDQVDEFQLTICPRMIGGDKTWIPIGNNCTNLAIGNSNSWQLKSINTLEGNEVLINYLRNRK